MMGKMTKETCIKYRIVARDIYFTSDCQIDDDAKLAEVKQFGKRIGAWVAAFVWVFSEDMTESEIVQ